MQTGSRQLLLVQVALAASLSLGVIALSGCSGLAGHPASTLSAATTSEKVSPDKSRRPPPGKVSSIFRSFPSQIPCPPAETHWVSAGSDNVDFTITELDFEYVCFSGVSYSSSLSLIVITPSGTRHTIATSSTGDPLDWELNPGPGNAPVDTLGRYSFELLGPLTAGQESPAPSPNTPPSLATIPGDSSATVPQSGVIAAGHFTVAQPAAPNAEAIYGGSPGQPLLVSLAGYPPNSVVSAALYGPGAYGASTFPLLSNLPDVTTNATGEAILRWIIPEGTPSGNYAILINPPPSSCSATEACLPFNIST